MINIVDEVVFHLSNNELYYTDTRQSTVRPYVLW